MNKINLYLRLKPGISPPEGAKVSLKAYKIGSSFHLLRAGNIGAAGEVMEIDCTGFTGYGPHELLISEIVYEARRHCFSGVFMDVQPPVTEAKKIFLGRLGALCERHFLALYAPLPYSCASGTVRVLIPALCTEGTFRRMIEGYCAKIAAERLALLFKSEPITFPLPSKVMGGVTMSERELSQISARQKLVHRHSAELCEDYAVLVKDGRSHMMLRECEKGAAEKLKIAGSLGIPAAFFDSAALLGTVRNHH